MPIPTRIPSPLKASHRPPGNTRHLVEDDGQLQHDRRNPQPHTSLTSHRSKPQDVREGDIGPRTGHARSASTVDDGKTSTTLDASHTAKPKATLLRGIGRSAQGQARLPARERPINASSAAKKPSSESYEATVLPSKPINANLKNSRGNHAAGALKRSEFDSSKMHLSPVKPKAATPSVTNAHQVNSAEVNEVDALSRHCTGHTDELFQLSLLYNDSTASVGRFSHSMCQQLNTRYSALERQVRRVGLLARAHSSSVNTQAVVRLTQGSWPQDGAGSDRLSVLAECLQEVDRLTRSGGLLERVMSQFQAWQELTLAASRDRVNPKSNEMLLVSPLEVQWWHSVQILESKMKFSRMSLDGLGMDKDDSAVAALIEAMTAYVEQSMQEIDLCKTVAGMSMRREHDWVRAAIAEAIAEGKADHLQDTTNGVRRGVWAVV